jgi:hypothetical protein
MRRFQAVLFHVERCPVHMPLFHVKQPARAPFPKATLSLPLRLERSRPKVAAQIWAPKVISGFRRALLLAIPSNRIRPCTSGSESPRPEHSVGRAPLPGGRQPFARRIRSSSLPHRVLLSPAESPESRHRSLCHTLVEVLSAILWTQTKIHSSGSERLRISLECE